MTPIHLARQVDFQFLRSKLQENIDNRSVYEVTQGNLSIFCYTTACVYNQMWNPWNAIARGLIIDRASQQIIATPFPKFFNYTPNISLPNSPFETYEKLDGSLGICYYYQNQWRIATKSHFNSPQAQWAQNYLSQLNLNYLIPGTTYLFEIIYHANKIVVKYPQEGLVLLSAYKANGEEFTWQEIEILGENIKVTIAHKYNFTNLQEIIALSTRLEDNQEGFVIKYPCGLRLKNKGTVYLQLHKIISDITPHKVWELMKEGKDLEKFRSSIPEEHQEEFDRLVRAFEKKLFALIAEVDRYHELYKNYSPKELSFHLDTLPEIPRKFIFMPRKLGELWYKDHLTKTKLFKLLRPVP